MSPFSITDPEIEAAHTSHRRPMPAQSHEIPQALGDPSPMINQIKLHGFINTWQTPAL